MKVRVYVYRTYKNGELIKEGILTNCVDVFIEELTDIETSSDKCLWDVQKYLDKNYKKDKYEFEYKEVEINVSRYFKKCKKDTDMTPWRS